MPLTPTLPVNKNTLDKRIEVNLPINNGQQLITAQKLQETLTPIVNSTYGLKTIWAGYIYSSFTGGRSNYQYYENYYDPYYFPPVQDPLGALTLNSLLNKYQVTDKGSGLRVNTLATGSFTNVSATLLSTNTSNGRFGGGLTFDGTITDGILSSLTVNNPGMGYTDGFSTNTLLQLNLTVIGGGVLPKLKFNMQRTMWPANNAGGFGNGWWANQNNVFIPNIENIFPMLPVDQLALGVQLSYSDCNAAESTLVRSSSRLSRAFSNSTTLYKTGGDGGSADQPGFFFGQYCQSDGSAGTLDQGLGSLEIKVPIVYQPTVI